MELEIRQVVHAVVESRKEQPVNDAGLMIPEHAAMVAGHVDAAGAAVVCADLRDMALPMQRALDYLEGRDAWPVTSETIAYHVVALAKLHYGLLRLSALASALDARANPEPAQHDADANKGTGREP